MGRPPSNGTPSFRFNPAEVAQMEAILQKHEGHVPPRDLLVALAQRFSQSPERAGKMVVQMKQVWNWFQNRRYALRAKSVEPSGKPSNSPVTRNDVAPLMMNVPSVPQQITVSSGPHVAGSTSGGPILEYEAKSARDGAWYDVQMFISIRHLDTANPEVLVRFAGFGPEEDEWVNIVKHVRQRSLPCEASECIVVAPGDLILCFQEGKEQALYFDAHVLDAQRRRHDVRGCRCRFLVRYDHDQSEEIVPLRKICRRPETDYRLQQLNVTTEAPASAAAPTSLSVGPSTPVISTSATALGMPNPKPSAAAATVSPSPIVGAGPSVRPPAPAPPAPTPAPAPAPAAPAPAPAPALPTSVAASTLPTSYSTPTLPLGPPVLEQKKVESVNPAEISVLDPNKSEAGQVSGSVPKMAESVNPTPVLIPVPEVNKVEAVNPTPILTPLPGPSKVETNIPAFAPVPESFKVEDDNPALVPVLELSKVVSNDPVSVPGSSKVETVVPAFAAVPEPETKKVVSDIPVLVPESNETASDMLVSVPQPNKGEGDFPIAVDKVNSDISIAAATEPNKVESNISVPEPEPKNIGSDILVSATVASINVGTSNSETCAEANTASPGAVNKVLEVNQADNSKPETAAPTVSNIVKEQLSLSGNPAISVAGPEKAEAHDGTETASTVAGSSEATVATEDVKY